jgi:peptidyl-prolyl cis-trans isomerase B (cyclophilin B)
MGGSEKRIPGEFSSNGFNNNHKHVRGTISMARSMDPNSASSQFFICHVDTPHLDGGYAAFGQMVEGFDVLDDLARLRTDWRDKPLDPPVIKSIYVE